MPRGTTRPRPRPAPKPQMPKEKPNRRARNPIIEKTTTVLKRKR